MLSSHVVCHQKLYGEIYVLIWFDFYVFVVLIILFFFYENCCKSNRGQTELFHVGQINIWNFYDLQEEREAK